MAFTEPNVLQLTLNEGQSTLTAILNVSSFPFTCQHDAPKNLETEAETEYILVFAVLITGTILALMAFSMLSSFISLRYCRNYLPSLGVDILLDIPYGNMVRGAGYTWPGILMPAKARITAQLRTLRTLQRNINNQIRQELSLHLDQTAEIADWAVVPQPIIQSRINRRKEVMMLQKGATIVRIRREIYSRALGYIDTVAERKRGQRISWRDLFLASWIYAYCIFLWFFELAFASIWRLLCWFELALVYMTEP